MNQLIFSNIIKIQMQAFHGVAGLKIHNKNRKKYQ